MQSLFFISINIILFSNVREIENLKDREREREKLY